MKTDNSTIRQLQKGNIKIYETLFRSLYPALCGFALKYTNGKVEAEEIVQEVFYQLWSKRETLNISTSLKAYLYKMVQNQALLAIRHKQVEQKYVDYLSHQSYSNPTPEDGMQSGEFYMVYKETLKQLPERCQQIFYMNRVLGLKYKEIAEKLAVSIKTVEANMGRALKEFRTSFAQYNLSE